MHQKQALEWVRRKDCIMWIATPNPQTSSKLALLLADMPWAQVTVLKSKYAERWWEQAAWCRISTFFCSFFRFLALFFFFFFFFFETRLWLGLSLSWPGLAWVYDQGKFCVKPKMTNFRKIFLSETWQVIRTHYKASETRVRMSATRWLHHEKYDARTLDPPSGPAGGLWLK